MNFALKINNNTYYPLCKEYLDITDEYDRLDSLEKIDIFTAKHTDGEIKSSIKRSNILNEEQIDNSELVIIYYDKKRIRELQVYTADNIDYLEFDTLDFILQKSSNKNILNQIDNHFSSKNYIPQDLQQFASILNRYTLIYITVSYDNLCYISRRLLKDYIFNEVLRRIDVNKLERKND